MPSNPVITDLLHFSKNLTLPPSAMTVSYFNSLLTLSISPHSPLYLMTVSYTLLKKTDYDPGMSESSRLQIYTHECTLIHLSFPPASTLATCAPDPFHFHHPKDFLTAGLYSLFRKFTFFLSYLFNHTNPFIDTISPFSYHSVVLYCLNSQEYCLHIFSLSPHLF